ncbi:MAG: hypothetical protein ABI885_02130 [Gammaproteobacteria bacterium]
MTITTLLTFMVLSQIAVAAYLLYSFNDVERESRKRTADLRAHIDSALMDLESRLNGGPAVSPRRRPAGTPLVDTTTGAHPPAGAQPAGV